MRITPEEKATIEQTFGGNTKLLKLMRKIFLPEYDPNAPLGQTIDLWMTINLENLTSQEKEIRIQARNEVILHIENQLIQLKSLSQKLETTEEVIKRINKNSAK